MEIKYLEEREFNNCGHIKFTVLGLEETEERFYNNEIFETDWELQDGILIIKNRLIPRTFKKLLASDFNASLPALDKFIRGAKYKMLKQTDLKTGVREAECLGIDYKRHLIKFKIGNREHIFKLKVSKIEDSYFAINEIKDYCNILTTDIIK